jgi:predicted aspartyl protease
MTSNSRFPHRNTARLEKSTMRARVLASLGFTIVPVMCWPTSAPASQAAEPIRLPLTFIQSNPVTTIGVGDRAVQAIVDTGGGALTLSKEVLDSAGAVSLGETTVGTDYLGREHSQPRFRVPIVTIGGHPFQNVTVIQAPQHPPGNGPPVPNGIGRHFLSQYFVVVDYAGASITLWPSNAKTTVSKNCGRTRIPLEHTEEDTELAVSEFDTQVGRVRLLWDTGATGSMLPATTAEKLRLATTTRGNSTFWQAKVFSAAGHDFGPIEFVVQPANLPRDFEGLLGRNFFERHIVCLDYKRRAVWVR